MSCAIPNFDKLSIAQLKEFLKEHNCTLAGEKATLIFRARAWVDGESRLVDGKNPTHLKADCFNLWDYFCNAPRGLSPIGSNDELLESLMGKLRKQSSSSTASSPGSNSGKSGGVETAASLLADRVVELGERSDWLAIMSLLDPSPLDKNTDSGELRRAYRALSLLIHPDRLRNCPSATRAFQLLVQAYEFICEPEPVAKSGRGYSGPVALSRSNAGCHRTEVECPRCHEAWGGAVQGVEPYFYNWLMSGLKTYHCATCLCEFGCMTAIHRCPHCRHPFEYNPTLYHQKITCERAKCGHLRVEIQAHVEQRARTTEARIAREARTAKRGGGDGSDAADDRALRESLYANGLIDNCPRCGEASEADAGDKQAHRDHLKQCTNHSSHAHHQKREAAAKAAASAKVQRQQAQDDVASGAAWSFLGGSKANLWMLTDTQLKQQVGDAERSEGLNRDQMLMLLSGPVTTSSKRLTSGKTTATSTSTTMVGTKRKPVAAASTSRKSNYSEKSDDDSNIDDEDTLEPSARLPTNLHRCSEAQLRAVCAAQRISVTGLTAKCDLIRALERRHHQVDDAEVDSDDASKPIRPVSQKQTKKAAPKKKSKADSDDSSEDSDPENDDEYIAD